MAALGEELDESGGVEDLSLGLDDQLVRRVELVAGPLRNQDLAAAARLRDPRSPMDVDAVVGAFAERWLARVHAHAHADFLAGGGEELAAIGSMKKAAECCRKSGDT